MILSGADLAQFLSEFLTGHRSGPKIGGSVGNYPGKIFAATPSRLA